MNTKLTRISKQPWRSNLVTYFPSVTFYFFGVLVSVLVADFLLRRTQELLRQTLKKENPGKKTPPIVPVLPRVLGLVERPLYLIALYIKEPVFIGFWLTLKAASRWETWSKEEPNSIPGRAYFNIFLIGNALSILYAFAGYGIIVWGEFSRIEENCLLGLAALLLILANATLNFWLNKNLRAKTK